MHYFGIPGHSRSFVAYEFFIQYFWEVWFIIALWECCQNALLDGDFSLSSTQGHYSTVSWDQLPYLQALS